MEPDQDLEPLRLLQDAYESTREHYQEIRTAYLERLEQLRHDFDTRIESSVLEVQQMVPHEQSLQQAIEGIRTLFPRTVSEPAALDNGHNADLEDELFRVKEALSSSELRIKELQQQVRAGVSENLNSYIDNLKSQITKKNEIIDIARKRILRLQQKIEGMAYERMEALQNAADLKMQIALKTEALQEKEMLLGELQRKLSLKMSCMAAVNAQLEAVEQHLEALKKQDASPHRTPELSEAASEQEDKPASEAFAKTQSELDDANTLLELMQVDLNRYQENLEEAATKRRSLEQELATANEELVQSTAALNEKESHIETLQQEKDALHRQTNQFQQDLNACRVKQEQDETNALALQEAMDKAAARITCLEKELQEKGNALQAVLNDKDALNSQITHLQTQLKTRQDVRASEQASLQEKEQLLETVTGDFQQARILNKQHQAEIETLKQRIAEYEAASTKASESSQHAEKALEAERHRVIEEKLRCESLEKTLAQAKAQASSLQEALENETNKAAHSEASLQAALGEVKAAQKVSQSAETAVEDAHNTINALSGQLDQANQELAQLKEHKSKADQNLTEVQQLLKQKNTETDDLASRLEISDEERQEAGIAISEMRLEIETLRGTVYEALSEKDAALTKIKELSAKLKHLESAPKKSVSTRKLAALQEELDTERRRADMTQQLLDEALSGGTKAKLARQLEASKQECANLQQELKQLRKHSGKQQ